MGRPAEAPAVYHTFRKTLTGVLGEDPSPVLQPILYCSPDGPLVAGR